MWFWLGSTLEQEKVRQNMSVVSNRGAPRPLVVTRDGSSEDASPKEWQIWCFRLVPEEKVSPVSNVDALGLGEAMLQL
jgi:hypothetical protein